jgi:putative peptidoglycan lipid II flippase
LYRGLRQADVIQHASGWLQLMGRVLVANVVMAAVLLQLQRPLSWWFATGGVDRAAWLCVSVIAGAGAYFGILLLLGTRLSQFRLR